MKNGSSIQRREPRVASPSSEHQDDRRRSSPCRCRPAARGSASSRSARRRASARSRRRRRSPGGRRSSTGRPGRRSLVATPSVKMLRTRSARSRRAAAAGRGCGSRRARTGSRASGASKVCGARTAIRRSITPPAPARSRPRRRFDSSTVEQLSRIWRATGAAASAPKPPCSIVTATTILRVVGTGASADVPGLVALAGPRSAVPVLPAIVDREAAEDRVGGAARLHRGRRAGRPGSPAGRRGRCRRGARRRVDLLHDAAARVLDLAARRAGGRRRRRWRSPRRRPPSAAGRPAGRPGRPRG